MKGGYLIAGRVVLILSIVFLLTQCGRRRAHGAAAFSNLKDLTQLQQVFNSDRGRVRLLALLSPV